MSYGLTKAHSPLMRLMNHVLRSFLGNFVVVNFDYILVCRLNLQEHIAHGRRVLEMLRKGKLYLLGLWCARTA